MEHHGLALQMVDRQLRPRNIHNEELLQAMMDVPRHLFVPNVSPEVAYSDHALAIGCGQTISQPFIVARMTELLDVCPGSKVLEIGTGSGYQAAILAQMGAAVVTVERHSCLANCTRDLLYGLMPKADIRIIEADGTLGYPPLGPYDRILVTAAAPSLPPAYEVQLTQSGRIVIPLGDRMLQKLNIFNRRNGKLHRTVDLDCCFVPLIGPGAF